MKLSLRDIDIKGKKIFARVDFNVPLTENLAVADDTRIGECLPTIEYALSRGAGLVLASHLGRPKGKPSEKFGLKPVAERLGVLLKKPVLFAGDCVGEDAESKARSLKPGEVLLLENLRFHKEEEANDAEFAKKLASLADIYINDAFGTSHRAHASVSAVTKYFKFASAGLLMEKEIFYLGKLLRNPARPFAAIIGGAKLETKVDVLKNLLNIADKILVGGGMSYTFFKAQGMPIGKSLVDDNLLNTAVEILALSEEKGSRLVLPEDHISAATLSAGAPSRVSAVNVINADWTGADIGQETVDIYKEHIGKAGTVFWNGPMGVYEISPFDEGTKAIASAIAETSGTKVAGGGDTIAVLAEMKLQSKFDHISTGGGASLEFISGKKLPGIEALTDK